MSDSGRYSNQRSSYKKDNEGRQKKKMHYILSILDTEKWENYIKHMEEVTRRSPA